MTGRKGLRDGPLPENSQVHSRPPAEMQPQLIGVKYSAVRPWSELYTHTCTQFSIKRLHRLSLAVIDTDPICHKYRNER